MLNGKVRCLCATSDKLGGGLDQGRTTSIAPLQTPRLVKHSAVALARGRTPGCRLRGGCGHRANHALSEARRADAERQVEAPAHVLKRDYVRELHDLALVKVLPQPDEEHIGHLHRRPAHADRGAVPPGALVEIHGARPVAEQALAFARLAGFARPVLVNGTPGIVASLPDGRPLSVMGFTVARGKIVEIDILADPARLRQIDLTSHKDHDDR